MDLRIGGEIRVKIHIVQKGDTLWKIAKKYGVNFEELKKMNSQLSNPDMIMPGMKIKVPTVGANIMKEAPIGAQKETISKGATKEKPKKEHPFTKEKPIAPAVEIPVEKPKEKPITPAPIKETKKPYIPKMPQPIIPDIDINNYFVTNMSNVNVHEQAKEQPPAPAPQLPLMPVNILPEMKEEIKPAKEQVKPIKEQVQQVKEQVKPVPAPQPPLMPVNILPEMKEKN